MPDKPNGEGSECVVRMDDGSWRMYYAEKDFLVQTGAAEIGWGYEVNNGGKWRRVSLSTLHSLHLHPSEGKDSLQGVRTADGRKEPITWREMRALNMLLISRCGEQLVEKSMRWMKLYYENISVVYIVREMV